MIKILLIGLSNTFKEYLINKFISMGVSINATANLEESKKFLEKKNITHIIVNIDNIEDDYDQVINYIKSQEGPHNIYIFVQTRRLDRQFIHSMLKKGVIGFLSTTPDLDYLFLRIQQILNSTGHYPNKRAFFRVWASEEDDLRISFPIAKYSNSVTGSIRVIGLGGLAFKLDKPEDSSRLKKGDFFDSVQIKLNDNRIVTKIQIMKPGVITGAQFAESLVNDNFTTFLCNFIYKKLIEDEDDVSLHREG